MASVLERAQEELAKKQAPSTIERAQQEQASRGFNPFEAVGQAVVGAGKAVVGAVRGQQDPAFADVPGFTGRGIRDRESATKIAQAKVLGVSDEVFGRLIKDALGDRITNVETDKFGQEVITYTDDDGQQRREFINKPGLTGQDIDRVIQNSLPFLIGGGAVGAATRGAGLLARVGAQTVGQIGVSAGQDIAADAPLDPGKAVAAGAGGAIGELAAPVIRGLVDVFRNNKGLITPGGEFTKRGIQALRDAEVDPAQATDQLKALLSAPDVVKSADDVQAVMRAQQEEFGISSSLGQRTGIPAELSIEEQARKGLLGQRAKDVATEFDQTQREQIIAAVNRETEQFGAGIDAAAPVTPGEAGERLQTGLRSEIATQEAGISKAFGEVDIPSVFPEGIPETNFDDLAAGINQQLGTRTITTQTPAAADAVTLLENFAKGEALQPQQAFLARGAESTRIAAPKQNFDDVRRALNTKVGEAANATDRGATLAIKRGYNEWIEELADGALESANPEQFAKLQSAIGLTAKVKQLFKSQGPKDAGGKILEKIAEGTDSPEGAIQALFQSGFKGAPKAGAVNAAKRLKTALEKNQPEAWHAIRQALWLKMARTKNLFSADPAITRQGLDTSIGQINRNITDAFDNQKSLLDVIYSPEEQKQMLKFAATVRRAQSVNPNPSGTAFEAQRMRLAANDNVFVNLLKRQAASEQLAKNSLRAVFWRQMTKVAAGTGTRLGEAGAGRSAARRFSGALPPGRGQPAVPVGGAIGVQLEN